MLNVLLLIFPIVFSISCTKITPELLNQKTFSSIVSPPGVAVLSNTPASTSNLTNLNISVGGTGVVKYRYKVGQQALTNCALAAGYSGTDILVATAIVDNISALPDVGVRLCVVGSPLTTKCKPMHKQQNTIGLKTLWVRQLQMSPYCNPMRGMVWGKRLQFV